MLEILEHDENGIIDINELQLVLSSLEEILSDCDLINMMNEADIDYSEVEFEGIF